MTTIAMTVHNSRNESNRRNESNNRTPKTVGTQAKAVMLAKVVKQQHEANLSRAPVKISRKFSNIREDIIIQQGHLQQQQEFTTRTSATASETIGTSQTSTAEGRPATAEMPEIVEGANNSFYSTFVHFLAESLFSACSEFMPFYIRTFFGEKVI
jgi:hypothetical protein